MLALLISLLGVAISTAGADPTTSRAEPDAAVPVAAPASTRTYVGEKACSQCHTTTNEHFAHTVHAKTFRLNPRNELEGRVCEACHGPGSLHIQNPTDHSTLIGFTRRWGTSSPYAGGNDYPLANAWSVESGDHNDAFGLGVQYDFTKFKVDIKYTFANARSPVSYQENSPGATTIPLTADQIGGGYPDLTYRQHLAEANLIFPFKAKLAARLFYRYENTRIADWHYSGLWDNLLQGQRLYLDAGPENYHANVFGVFIQYRL